MDHLSHNHYISQVLQGSLLGPVLFSHIDSATDRPAPPQDPPSAKLYMLHHSLPPSPTPTSLRANPGPQMMMTQPSCALSTQMNQPTMEGTQQLLPVSDLDWRQYISSHNHSFLLTSCDLKPRLFYNHAHEY